MEVLLWRWSTAVQVASLLMITVFFAVLRRSVRRVELRWWSLAWVLNLAALASTLLYWYFRPPWPLGRFAAAVYLGGKLAFVLLLLQGACSLLRPDSLLLSPRQGGAAVGLYTVIGFIFLTGVEPLGLVHHFVLGMLFAAGAWELLRSPEAGLTWLGGGFGARALLSFVESAAYGVTLAPEGLFTDGIRLVTGRFLSASSSFDTASEWLIVLGCVLALSERSQRELRSANQELLAAQEDLRRMADRDPLTGLSNRRALPEILRSVQPGGATLLFFDLDGFKKVNDLHGHQAGDEWLRRFARALGDSFRPADAVVRYAGDEFLVVAAGLSRSAIAERVETLTAHLRRPGDGLPIAFSVGIAELAPGGQPSEALRAADEAMYASRYSRLLKNA